MPGDAKSLISPTRWVAAVSNILLKWVGQRTILVFILMEIAMCTFLFFWFWRHKQVAMLGLVLTGWKTYLILFGLRVAIAGYGLYAVWIRRIQLTKIFYGLFFLSGLLAILAVYPVHNMSCKCTDFLQCAVLASFAPPGEVLNPFWEPDLKYFESKRKLRYAKPPTDPAKALGFKEELLLAARKKANKPVEGAILENQATVSHIRRGVPKGDDDAVIVESLAFGHGRLVNKRRRHGRHGSLATDHASARQEHGRSLVQTQEGLHFVEEPKGNMSTEASLAKVEQATLPRAVLDGPKKEESLGPLQGETIGSVQSVGADQMDAEVSRQPLRFFNVTEPGITWVGNEAPWCETREEDRASAARIKSRLKQAALDAETKLDDYLTSKLFVCAIDAGCGVVSAEVIEEADGSYKYKICQHSLQLVPVPVSDQEAIAKGAPQQVGPDGTYFQRNPMTVRLHLESTNARPNNFYKYAFRSLESGAAVKMLQSLQRATCTCDFKDSEGCQTYEDSLGKSKFWCYVKESRRQRCLDDGVRIYWDAKAEKIWSDELCESAGCSCSELGMHPTNIKDPNINASLLNSNRMNYGSHCASWNTAPAHEWCYVGWDSTCPDRIKADNIWVSEDNPRWPTIFAQYKSRLPCQAEAQQKIREVTAEGCEDWSRVVELLMLIQTFSFLPMTVIIFKFLSNRCGDEFQAEEQFAVVLSTDEEESEDEWEHGATQERKEKREDTDEEEPKPPSHAGR